MCIWLLQATGPGVSSYIEFNTDASPKNPRFDIVNLKRNGWEQVCQIAKMTAVKVQKQTEDIEIEVCCPFLVLC